MSYNASGYGICLAFVKISYIAGCVCICSNRIEGAWISSAGSSKLIFKPRLPSFHHNVFHFLFPSFSFFQSTHFILSMRAPKVTSFVRLAPFLLILPAFLVFVLVAHSQTWCQPFSEVSPTLSTWNSTATTLLSIQEPTPPPSYTIENTNTTTISSSSRSSSLLQTWLKRWRHSKRESPALWFLCGGTFLFCSMYLHKVTKQTIMTNQIQLTGLFFSIQARHSPAIKVALLYVSKMRSSTTITAVNNRLNTASYKTPRSKKARKRSNNNNKNKRSTTQAQQYPCADDNVIVHSTSDWCKVSDPEKAPSPSVMDDAPSNNKKEHRPPVITKWYSPFYTGLDLALVTRSDPLIHLDPIRNPPCEPHSTTTASIKRHPHTFGAIGQAIPSF